MPDPVPVQMQEPDSSATVQVVDDRNDSTHRGPDLTTASWWTQFKSMFRFRLRLFQSDFASAVPLFGLPLFFCIFLLIFAKSDDSVENRRVIPNPTPYKNFITFVPSYVGGGSADSWAVDAIRAEANTTIMEYRKQRFNKKLIQFFMKPFWHKADSMGDLKALSTQYASFYAAKLDDEQPETIPPFGGFLLHSAPTPNDPTAPLNVSIVLNPNPNLLTWTLDIPQLMINSILNGAQRVLPPGPTNVSNVPPASVLAEAASEQNPRFNFRPPPPEPGDADIGKGFMALLAQTPPETGAADGSFPASFNASAYTRIAERMVALHQSSSSGGIPPWALQLNGTRLPYKIHPSEAVSFASYFVPPTLTMAIFFLLIAATRNMVAERVEGQFAYFFTNGLSPSAFYLSTIAIYLCAAAIGLVVISFFMMGAKYMSIGLAFLLMLGFTIVVILQSAVLSFMFDSKESVPSVLFLFVIAASVGPQIFSYLLKITLSSTTSMILYVVLPSFAINKCFLEMVLANTDLTSYRPFAPESGSVYPLTLGILAGHIVVFLFGTVYLAQRASRDPLRTEALFTLPSFLTGKSKGNNSGPDEDDEEAVRDVSIPTDPHIVAERARIQAGTDAENDVVRIQGLSMSFPGASAGKDGRHQVLDDLWFTVRKNEVFAFLGPNGAGKSTTINIITGLLKPVSGTATVCGKTPDDPAVKRLFGVCPQYDHVYRTMSVYNHLRTFAEIKGVPSEYVEDAVNKAIEDAMLEDFRHRAVRELSGGTRRRLTIAIACLGRPAVVILDEPTTGVDIATRRTIWEMINRLKQHMSVLLVTHDMDEADRLSQRAGIMINGSLVCLGSPARLKSLFGSAYLLKLQFAYATPSDTLDRALAAIQSKIDSFEGNVIKMRLVHRGESSMEIAIDMPDEPKGDSTIDDDASSTKSVAHASFLGDMLEFMTDNRWQWNVTDWTLGELTLTELFVRLAQHHRSYQDEEDVKHSHGTHGLAMEPTSSPALQS